MAFFDREELVEALAFLQDPAAVSLRSRLDQRLVGPLLRTVRSAHPESDVSLIERAYFVAEKAHRGQMRKSGDPYITHPVAVSTILAELGFEGTTIAAALLHDTVEDTDYSLDSLRSDFGDDVALLVDGVTKLDKVKYGDAAQAETVRKMVVAMAKDIRVLVIKLADRLHNARTWKYVPSKSAERKARETLEIYTPLAGRLGLNTIKRELEDLSFQTLYPKVYDEIVNLVAERAPALEEFLDVVKGRIELDLRSAKIKATVTGRHKHYYSIYQKMIVRGYDFAEMFDLVGVRIIADNVRDCYAALGAMHARWNPVPGRFKDYISMPQFNMYQSLHTTVIGPGGKPVEIQIRTPEMHRRAEYGASPPSQTYIDSAGREQLYGEAHGSEMATYHPKGRDMAWLNQLVDWQHETAGPAELLDSLRFEIGDEVYVFTPKGMAMALPGGATPVDFAYAVHTEVGHRTMGARVNGRPVPLDSPLENGDVVDILTSKSDTAGPSRYWLGFVRSPKARKKIRRWFTRERREEPVETGKDSIAKAMRKQGLPVERLMSHETLLGVADEMNYQDVIALYAAVGEGLISANNVVDKLVKALGGADGAEADVAEAARPGGFTARRVRSGDPGVMPKGSDSADVWVKLAKCCRPVPGDDIVGLVNYGHGHGHGQGVSVHRSDCVNLDGLRKQPGRLVEVEWTQGASTMFLVQIQVEALDRSRLLSDVTRVLSENQAKVHSALVSTSDDRLAVSRFIFEMAEPAHLATVLAVVRKVEGVFDVHRITGTRPVERQQQADEALDGTEEDVETVKDPNETSS
ncbi:RelA/SpoT family protein [Promicromonospora sp. NFX87]|uniref:RelA/SpoT family protein n=1 Tax=Promicromonospora sp. NFX87 TaxID=3402691 RepID=UPI003AFB3158